MNLNFLDWNISRAFNQGNPAKAISFVNVTFTRIGNNSSIRCLKLPTPVPGLIFINEVDHNGQ